MRTLVFVLLVIAASLGLTGQANAATSTRSAGLTMQQVTPPILPAADGDAAFDTAPESDEALAGSCGGASPAITRAALLSQTPAGLTHVATDTRVMLDVWMLDVAQPLIISNLVRPAPAG